MVDLHCPESFSVGPRTKAILTWGIYLCSSGAIVLAILGLLGWIFEVPGLTNFIPNTKSLAPLASLLLIVIAFLLIAQVGHEWHRRGREVAALLSTFLALGGLLGSFLGFFSSDSRWAPPTALPFSLHSSPNAVPSPIALLLAGLIAGAIAWRLYQSLSSSRSLCLSGWIGALVVLLSAVFLLDYAYGMLWLYKSHIVPIALPACLAFFLLGTAVIAANPESYPLRWVIGPTTRARLLRVFLPFTLMAVLITAISQANMTLVFSSSSALASALALVVLLLMTGVVVSFAARELSREIDAAQDKRYKAEVALRVESERYRSLFEHMVEGFAYCRMIFVDNQPRDFIYLTVNTAFEQLTGLTNVIGRLVSDVIPGIQESDPALLETYGRVALTGKPERFEMYVEALAMWFSISVYSPETGYFVAVFDVITDRKEAAAALAAEKERLAVTLRSIGDGVIATDNHARIVVFNKVAEELTGWSAAEAMGRPLNEVFCIVNAHSRECCEDPVAKVLSTGLVIGLANHTVLLARDGREYVIADSGAPIRNHESQVIGVVLVFRDVTYEERREAELMKSEKLASLAVLAGGIAHDFNNLLTGILGNLSLGLLDTGEQASLHGSLLAAESAALRARGLTQQLLTFSKGGSPVKNLANLGEVVRDTALFSTRGSTVACRITIDDALWPAEVDAGQIGQVIQNIVINGSEAMPNGGTLTVNVENLMLAADNPMLLPGGPYVTIRISDQGIGMPPELLDHIFDPYYTTKQQGSGLGLAICHSIIANHDGRIEVTSTPGKGSLFSIYLPASPANAMHAAETRLPAPARGGRILVMDDEEMIRHLAKRMLESLGCHVATVADGQQALTCYQKALEAGTPFDAIIMDLTIPGGMGGKEAITHLKALHPQARVIVSSGYSTDPIMANYADYGFAAVLTKPYRIHDITETLARILPSSE